MRDPALLSASESDRTTAPLADALVLVPQSTSIGFTASDMHSTFMLSATSVVSLKRLTKNRPKTRCA